MWATWQEWKGSFELDRDCSWVVSHIDRYLLLQQHVIKNLTPKKVLFEKIAEIRNSKSCFQAPFFRTM